MVCLEGLTGARQNAKTPCAYKGNTGFETKQWLVPPIRLFYQPVRPALCLRQAG